jgi:hypothetical protein
MALFLCAIPAFGQQSTTNTNCYVNGQQVNCTSNTTTNAPPPDPWANTSKQLQESGQRLGAALAANAQRKAAYNDQIDRIELNIAYCQQNPDHSITLANEKPRTCEDEIAMVRAFCSIDKKHAKVKFCKMLANMPALAPIAPSASMSDAMNTTSPSAQLTTSPAPASRAQPKVPAAQTLATLTEEQKDAISYCKRNPTATITWNSGTVSPCSSVLGAR